MEVIFFALALFFPFVASFQIVAIAGARPVIMDVISVALALRFPFVASFQIVAIAGARPVIMDVISVALALFFPVVAAFYINAFAPARPVIMEFVVLFPACRRADGQWPPLRVGDLKFTCHLGNGYLPTISIITGRAPARQIS